MHGGVLQIFFSQWAWPRASLHWNRPAWWPWFVPIVLSAVPASLFHCCCPQSPLARPHKRFFLGFLPPFPSRAKVADQGRSRLQSMYGGAGGNIPAVYDVNLVILLLGLNELSI